MLQLMLSALKVLDQFLPQDVRITLITDVLQIRSLHFVSHQSQGLAKW